MNTNTNNFVNRPEGARRPVSPNQTVEEQKHNAMMNQVDEFELDNDDEEFEVVEENNDNLNNMEDDNMLNNYTHTITFGNEESFKAVINEVLAPLYQDDLSENVYSEDYKTMYINVDALDETEQTILTVALCSRRNDEENYGQITIDNKLPAVSNNHIFRKVMDEKAVDTFYEQYVELQGLQGHFVALNITKNNVQKVEAIIFDITPEKKDELQTIFKTSMMMKKTAKKITKATNTINTVVECARKDIVTNVAGSVATVGVNVALTGVDAAKSVAKAAYKQVAKYAYENRFSKFYDEEMQNSTNLLKKAWDERKLMKGNKTDDEEFLF